MFLSCTIGWSNIININNYASLLCSPQGRCVVSIPCSEIWKADIHKQTRRRRDPYTEARAYAMYADISNPLLLILLDPIKAKGTSLRNKYMRNTIYIPCEIISLMNKGGECSHIVSSIFGRK